MENGFYSCPYIDDNIQSFLEVFAFFFVGGAAHLGPPPLDCGSVVPATLLTGQVKRAGENTGAGLPVFIY